jgi:SAM-dependent methyltransferase
VLGDVPVLVADPSAYCATFHDAILAALAEQGLADRESVAVVEAFAEGSTDAKQSFGDDWTSHELRGSDAPEPVRGAASAALSALLALAREKGPAAWIESHVKGGAIALELGCGAGARSEVLAGRVEKLVVGDLSLRAVLRARARAARQDAEVAGVVLNAEVLPFKRGALELIVAEHLIDLLDEPAEFFAQARKALKKGGVALVTTPDPALGFGDDDAASQLAKGAGFKVVERKDGLPWLRLNSSRFVETYLVQALALR